MPDEDDEDFVHLNVSQPAWGSTRDDPGLIADHDQLRQSAIDALTGADSFFFVATLAEVGGEVGLSSHTSVSRLPDDDPRAAKEIVVGAYELLVANAEEQLRRAREDFYPEIDLEDDDAEDRL